MERRLAAVLVSDVVGYTKLMEEDTEGTVTAWSEARDKIIEPSVESHNCLLYTSPSPRDQRGSRMAACA